MADDLAINISNSSSLAWTRNNWVCGAGKDPKVNWTDEVTQTPEQTLDPVTGQTTAAADTEHLGSIVEDDLYMTLGYVSTSGDEFALSITRRFHMLGIGKGDQWQTWENGAWTPWTENTSVRTWTFADCTVTATPHLSNDAASVDIYIQ